MTGDGVKTRQNVRTTSLVKGPQRLTSFNVTVRAFGSPDGNYVGSKWNGSESSKKQNEPLAGTTNVEMGDGPRCLETVSKGVVTAIISGGILLGGGELDALHPKQTWKVERLRTRILEMRELSEEGSRRIITDDHRPSDRRCKGYSGHGVRWGRE